MILNGHNRSRLAKWGSELWAGLWKFVLPLRCPLCGEQGGESLAPDFCPSCRGLLSLMEEPVCLVCGRPMHEESAPATRVCGFCQYQPPRFDQARACGLYQGALAIALREFKFKSKRALAPALASLMADTAEPWLSGTTVNAVLPVPLHPKRLRERGFNQSADLARGMAQRISAPLLFSALVRTRHTPPQVGLTIAQRKENVRGAFGMENPSAVKGKVLLLVDDVLTTGATVNECARVLKRAGAEKVLVLTLARAT